MGKTYHDIRKFNIKRQKEGSRMQTADMDLHTRVKPIEKKEKKLTLREIMDKAEEDTQDYYDDEFDNGEYDFEHAITGK